MISFQAVTTDNKKLYKQLRREFASYKIKTLRNHGETPGRKQMFYKLFDNIISTTATDKTMQFIVLQSGKDIIGFAYIATIDRDMANIPYRYGSVHDFYISPTHRRKGYGTKLNEHIEAVFKEHETNTILLYPDPVDGLPFWKAMDYKDTGIHQGWGHYLVFCKHLTQNDSAAVFDKAIEKLVTLTDTIGINPYNKPQVKEVYAVWKEYCKASDRKPRQKMIKKMAFDARKNRNIKFNAVYYKGKVIGFIYRNTEEIKFILPQHADLLKGHLQW